MIYFLVLAISVVFGSELGKCSPDWWLEGRGTDMIEDDHLDYIMEKECRPILIDWYLEYCGWCEKFLPDWNRLYRRLHKKVKFVKANGKKLRYFSNYFEVHSYPKIVIIMPNG